MSKQDKGTLDQSTRLVRNTVHSEQSSPNNCPKCGSPMRYDDHKWICPKCGHTPHT